MLCARGAIDLARALQYMHARHSIAQLGLTEHAQIRAHAISPSAHGGLTIAATKMTAHGAFQEPAWAAMTLNASCLIDAHFHRAALASKQMLILDMWGAALGASALPTAKERSDAHATRPKGNCLQWLAVSFTSH